jgi:hypothetical protein
MGKTWKLCQNRDNLSQQLVKGNAVSLQPLTGPESSRSLRLILRQTAHEGGKVVSPTHRPPLPPGNIPGGKGLEAESTSEP